MSPARQPPVAGPRERQRPIEACPSPQAGRRRRFSLLAAALLFLVAAGALTLLGFGVLSAPESGLLRHWPLGAALVVLAAALTGAGSLPGAKRDDSADPQSGCC